MPLPPTRPQPTPPRGVTGLHPLVPRRSPAVGRRGRWGGSWEAGPPGAAQCSRCSATEQHRAAAAVAAAIAAAAAAAAIAAAAVAAAAIAAAAVAAAATVVAVAAAAAVEGTAAVLRPPCL